MPGPWAWTLIGAAALACVFLAVMAFRGLVDSIDGVAERCRDCGRVTMLPLPVRGHECWRCRHPGLDIAHRRRTIALTQRGANPPTGDALIR